jgi:hypothetical protein
MIWRTTAVALLTTFAAVAGESNWAYSRLVDAPLAPPDRPVPLKILKVTAEAGPAADGDLRQASASKADKSKAKVVKTSLDSAIKLTPDTAVDPLSKTTSETWRVFVGGEVHRPGAFNAQRPFTALQAVIAAGGLKDAGKPTDIVVLRYKVKDAPPALKRVDLSASLAGKSADDLWLETHDVVIVPKAGSSTSTEEIVRSLPIPMAMAAKNKLVEVHRVKAEAGDAEKMPVLPAR